MVCTKSEKNFAPAAINNLSAARTFIFPKSGISLAASTAARAQEASTTAADDLLAMDTGENETADILLDESEELA